ncbi:MAG: DUF4959 domain-containing protein [Alistipes sp.]|nr:DUF4959 domain-containing protein [Alistipes sp.]
MKHYISFIAAAILMVGVTSCGKTESDDTRETVPPGPVSDVSFTPDYGGGTFSYTIPSDEDFLYVRAVYRIDNGTVISKSSSRFSRTLTVEGFGEAKEYEVALYAVDKNDNLSEPVWVKITPLRASVHPISESLNISAGFGSFYLEVENPYRSIVDIAVDLQTEDGRVATRYYTTSTPMDRILIRDLESIRYKITTRVIDNRYGHESEARSHGILQPVTDFLLSKDEFDFLDDRTLYGTENWDRDHNQPKETIMYRGQKISSSTVYKWDSMRNALEKFNECDIKFFWDGDPTGYSYFHTGDPDKGGPGWPWSYFIDMGREIQLSRFRIWQVGGSQWRVNGCKTFELYISNDNTPEDGILSDWECIGRFQFIRPNTEMEEQEEFEAGTEFWVDSEEPVLTRPFRYLRFKGCTDWAGTPNYNCGRLAEIDIYGKEVNQNE